MRTLVSYTWLGGVLAGVLVFCAPAAAQELPPYTIGAEDVLSVTFWPRSDFDQVVKVRQDGQIALPLIGETHVAGLTEVEAGERIFSRMSRYNRDVTQALVRVVEYHSRNVVVTGHVAVPGKLTYEHVPDLWRVLRDAGGPLETGDLSRVKMVPPSGRAELVNLARILAENRADSLAPLAAGTTVDVPAKMVPRETYRQLRQDREPVVYVTGGVITPGAVPLEGALSVYDVIARSGGFAPTADPKKVQVVSKGADGPVSYQIDLRPESKDRQAMTYVMQYEDMIIVGQKGRGVSELLRDVASVAAVITSVIVIYDYLSTDRSVGIR